jgi:hypothetical protein
VRNFLEVEFSEVRGSKLPNSGRPYGVGGGCAGLLLPFGNTLAT